MPAEIGQLTSLTSLEISSNQLTALPAELFQLTSLTSLNLSSNQLTALPAEIGQLTSLTSLNLWQPNHDAAGGTLSTHQTDVAQPLVQPTRQRCQRKSANSPD
ncbi:leucine-rich repeat domain-containing protein [Candidatus Amarolinea dominans]|uniref:leucine-rich repeat domain-containing protein n=1 Tax=Candidatus Amarolinea dominans TaxID=3140696 RepID=UPI001D878010|nr:leucine-rich repeat domain-containing protein [Anaerolineae bacterium]